MDSDRQHSATGQLNSWKEIARHLGVSVRTAMRWEKSEGLPAHRHRHEKLSSVYAYDSELDRWWRSRPDLRSEAPSALAPSRQTSLAVLPFTDLTMSEDGEILADGLTEELITLLSQLPGLRVVARTSSFAFKGKATDIRAIARQLGASTVIEGSLRMSGERLRVSAQLIDAADGFHIWSDNFDRRMEDLLDIQNSIATAIAGALEIRLTHGGIGPVLQRYGGNIEAYRLWLKGRYYLYRLQFETAIRSFEEALAIDPAMAPSFAGLADSFSALAAFSGLPREEGLSRAKQAVARALEIDPGLADAHVSLGVLAMTFEFDWPVAERALRRAVELNPSHSLAHTYLAGLLAATGRTEESHLHQRRACELDPASAVMLCSGAAEHIIHRRCRDALPLLARALELEPDLPLTYYWLAEAYLLLGEVGQLEVLARRAPPNLVAGFLGYSYAQAGRKADALCLLHELEAHAPAFWPALQIALLHLGFGDHHSTLQWLDRAREDCCWGVIWMAVDPLWDALRSDPGFRDLLAKLNLAGR